MATLIKPPPLDPDMSDIEGVLELTQLPDIDPDLYTNTRPIWQHPGARGIYGGTVIAQCLAAAHKSVPSDFTIHSMHCFFVLAGTSEIPIIYHVEHVRSGRSFATRTVQARQRGNVIFTTTMSFVKQGAGGSELVEHQITMPYVPGPDDESITDVSPQGFEGPVVSRRIDILNNDSPMPWTKKTRQWIKARGNISPKGGHEAHLAALAYMSDSYFVGTVARVHQLWRIPAARNNNRMTKLDEAVLRFLRNGDEGESKNSKPKEPRPIVSMMVSLDHSIYFHSPRDFRADDWIFTEMESPWSGDGRGLVIQKMFTKNGKLIATCVQEGVVRLKPKETKM